MRSTIQKTVSAFFFTLMSVAFVLAESSGNVEIASESAIVPEVNIASIYGCMLPDSWELEAFLPVEEEACEESEV